MEKKKTKQKVVVAAILIVIILFLALIGFITDFLWFRELGYVSVFFTKLFTQLKIGIPVFIVLSVLAHVYLKVLKRGYYKRIESNTDTNEKALGIITWVLSLIFGLIVTAICISQLWFKVLNAKNAVDFKLTDPLFDNDISFYIFKLPFVTSVNQIIIGVIIIFAIMTLIYYLILMSMHRPAVFSEGASQESDDDNFEEDRFTGFNGQNGFNGNMGDAFNKFGEAFQKKMAGKPKNRKSLNDSNMKELLAIASKQFIVLGVIFFLMIGVSFMLKQFTLLNSQRGIVYGAGFTDAIITLWVYRIIAVLSVFAAIGFAVGVTRRKAKTAVIVPVIMIAVGLVGAAGAVIVQNFVVSPDELSKETKYLEYNMDFTRSAYGLKNVDVKSFSASKNLDGNDINNNNETISNIRINDYLPARKFYDQTQSIRPYYDFNDVDVDRYMVNGEYTQTFLSAREINEEKINKTWINSHLKYTHGYGITLSRVDTVTASGQPDVLIGNLPCESDVKEINLKTPGIYFGESTNDYVMVGTDEKEFDYPDGDANKYTEYKGDAGIKMGLLNKIMFAIKERSIKLLVSSNIDSNSKIIINRNIKERVQKIMPYLAYDEDPYIVTVNGKLYWIIDAYTTSTNYPYSEPFQNTNANYIRNSVKVVIDAYNGDTDYYIVDKTDPIAQTLKGIYPKLFKDFDKMDEALKAHIRYPNTLLEIQADIYEKYHMTDANAFYQNEDIWSVANEMYGTKEKQMTGNYYIMNLPGEKQAEFVNTIVYTPKNKKNMTGLLVARNDGDKYGDLVLYKMPKSKAVYGPMQVEAMIDQNTKISQDFSLWDSSGSEYSRGNLFVIPIEDSLLYVEPIYLEATNSSIPEVKKVIVVFGDKIAYENTLAECLASMFGVDINNSGGPALNEGEGEGTTESGGKLSQSDLVKKAVNAFDNAQKAQQDGDWASYGKYLDELGQYLNDLQ